MERTIALLHHLYSLGKTVRCDEELRGSVHHLHFEYLGRAAPEKVDVLLGLDPKTHHEYLLGAINGQVSAMVVVSLMYASGLGMPEDERAAAAWARFSLLEPALDRTYQQAVDQLKKDRKEVLATCNNEGLIVPIKFMEVLSSMLPYYQSLPLDGAALTDARITPILTGMHVTLLYRPIKIDGKTQARLYGVVVPTSTGAVLSRSVHKHFNLPRVLGEIRGSATIPDYATFDSVKLYCVTGYLTTPRSLVAERKKLVHGKTVRSLFEAVTQGLINEQAIVEVHRSQYLASAKAELDRMSKDRVANRARIKRIKAIMKDPEVVRAKALKKAEAEMPRRYLQFVATDIMLFKRGGLYSADLKSRTEEHLMSLGFRSFNHRAVETVKYVHGKRKLGESELDNVFAMFEAAYPEYTVSRLMLRPSGKNVKINTAYHYRRQT